MYSRRREEIDHLGVFAEPCLMLRTSWNDHDVALAADPLFGGKADAMDTLASGIQRKSGDMRLRSRITQRSA
jgi:hypothetical protein